MQYLRLFYTCLYSVSDVGGSCLDPLDFLYDIPSTQKDNAYLDKTFMVAKALKVSPVMSNLTGTQVYQAYFPAGKWVNMADWSEIITGKDDSNINLANRKSVNVHLAPGALIPFQDNSDRLSYTTVEVLKKPISLIANRDTYGFA